MDASNANLLAYAQALANGSMQAKHHHYHQPQGGGARWGLWDCAPAPSAALAQMAAAAAAAAGGQWGPGAAAADPASQAAAQLWGMGMQGVPSLERPLQPTGPRAAPGEQQAANLSALSSTTQMVHSLCPCFAGVASWHSLLPVSFFAASAGPCRPQCLMWV
jgi:hypothetical protein